MKKDELLMVFPTPVQIYKYEDSIEKELKYIEDIDWLPQIANGNFKTKDSYLTKHEQLKKLVSFFKECRDIVYAAGDSFGRCIVFLKIRVSIFFPA